MTNINDLWNLQFMRQILMDLSMVALDFFQIVFFSHHNLNYFSYRVHNGSAGPGNPNAPGHKL